MVVILMHLRGYFAHQLGGDDGRYVVYVARGVKFDNVRPDDPRGLFGDDGQNFADR